jgi:hypothetical protein
MSHRPRRRPPTVARRQQGVTLVIGLIMLLVLTILAVSSMGTARLQLLMAGNTQARENAFQVAQAGLDARLAAYRANRAPLDAAPDCPPPGDPAVAPEATVAVPELGGEYTTRLCYRGLGPDLVIGSSVGKIEQSHYELAADASTSARAARSVLVQGFYVLQPASPEL